MILNLIKREVESKSINQYSNSLSRSKATHAGVN